MSFKMALAMSTIFGLILCFLIVCIGVVLQEAGMSKVNFVIDVEDILKQNTARQSTKIACLSFSSFYFKVSRNMDNWNVLMSSQYSLIVCHYLVET